MASVRAHLLNFILRHITRPMLEKVTTPLEARKAMNSAASLPNRHAQYDPGMVGGLTGEWVERRDHQPAFGTLLYLHGGAYLAMSPRTHRSITGGFAARGLRVFAPDYRLAPENPFPAAVDDALAAYLALVRDTRGPLFVAGDSAGGGLTLALLLRLRDEGRPLPAGAVVFSPWTDLVGTGESLRTNRDRDVMFNPDRLPDTAAAYYGAADPRHPYVSPLYGDYDGLPPLKIYVGEREILLDDSRRIANKARAAGVRVDLEIWPVVAHVWQLMAPLLPEASRSLNGAAEFLRSCVPR